MIGRLLLDVKESRRKPLYENPAQGVGKSVLQAANESTPEFGLALIPHSDMRPTVPASFSFSFHD